MANPDKNLPNINPAAQEFQSFIRKHPNPIWSGINKRIGFWMVPILLVCVLVFLVYFAQQTNSSVYKENYGIISSVTGKEIGKYTGKVNEDGFPDDTNGTLILNDGTVCSGSWNNGAVEGDFSCVFPNGSKYVGTISSDYRPIGKGIYTPINGNSQVLDNVSWVEEKIESNNSGLACSYTGMLVEEKWHGYGIVLWNDGDMYTGEHIADKRNGFGIYEYDENSIFLSYEGYWVNSEPHGEGTLTWRNGDIYVGSFENNTRQGQGTMTYCNGDVYTGSWVANMPEGQGIMTHANGDIYDGAWKNGQKHGYGKMTYSNGDIYEGMWGDGHRNGEGTLTWSSTGVYYKGNFVANDINGYGTFYPKASDPISAIWKWVRSRRETISGFYGTYEGMMSNQTLNGYGIFVHGYVEAEHEGVTRTIEGEFKDGTVHGYIKLTQTTDMERYTSDGVLIMNNAVYYSEAIDGAFKEFNHVIVDGAIRKQ